MCDLISVIIPVYNVKEYIHRCVDSVLVQTYQNLEIILVDDGSTDESGIICDELAQKDNRIKVIHQENGGLSAARNTGMLHATGEWISFIDSDDWIEHQFMEILLKEALQNNCDIVGCKFRKVLQKEAAITLNTEYEKNIYEFQDIMSALIDDKIRQVVWNKLYRRDLVKGILFEVGKYHEDEFWSYQVLANVDKYVECKYEGYNYFQRTNSIMGESYSLKRLHAIEAKVQRQNFLENNMEELATKGKISLLFTCLYHGQQVINYLSEKKQKEAMAFLQNIVRDNMLKNDESKQLSITQRVWIILARVSFTTTCKLRNLCKIGM